MLARLNDGGEIRSLQKTNKFNSKDEQKRPGAGWEEQVPSTQQQLKDDADQEKLKARRNNLQRQMSLALHRRKQTKEYKQPAAKTTSKNVTLRREISFPGLRMEDGRPPWKSMVTAHVKRPGSAAAGTGSRRRSRSETSPENELDAHGSGSSSSQHDLTTSPTTSSTTPRLPPTPRTPRSEADYQRNKAYKARMQKIHEKSEALKANLPSFYAPIEDYHPEVKQYVPRRRKYVHEHVVMSETPGAGRYSLPEFGSRINGGVISSSKPKSTIEWIQYYSRQIPAPGQYKPVNPNHDPNSQPCVRFPDFVGETELERIIRIAKQLPGPGQYPVPEKIQKGGIISKAIAKSDVDWMVYRASSIPGPADYPAPPLPKQGGGRFSNAVVPTETEILMRRSEQIPGPSEYDVNKMDTLPKGGKLNQDTNSKTWLDRIAMIASETPGSMAYRPLRYQAPGGGRFSTAKPKTSVEELIYNKREIPGPAKYGDADLPRRGGGKFNESRALSDVDLLMLRSAESPAPGDYNPRYADASQISQRFSTANPKSGVELLIYEKKNLPGPGQYNVKDPMLRGGVISKGKMKSDVDWAIYRASSIPGPKYDLPPMRVNGLFGKIGDGNPKSNLEWTIYRAAQLPGPGAYKINGEFDKEAGRDKRKNKKNRIKRSSSATSFAEKTEKAVKTSLD